MKIYIYTLEDPLSKEIRYVGVTNNLKRRLKNHIYTPKKTYTYSWILSLKDRGLFPIMKVIDSCSKKDIVSMERYWIEQLKA